MYDIFPELKSRRLFLKAAPALGLGAIGWTDVALAQDAVLKESDPEAAAIEFHSEATLVDAGKHPKYAVGQSCRNCSIFYADGGASSGACGIVFGKVVAATGWCASYEAKLPAI